MAAAQIAARRMRGGRRGAARSGRTACSAHNHGHGNWKPPAQVTANRRPRQRDQNGIPGSLGRPADHAAGAAGASWCDGVRRRVRGRVSACGGEPEALERAAKDRGYAASALTSSRAQPGNGASVHYQPALGARRGQSVFHPTPPPRTASQLTDLARLGRPALPSESRLPRLAQRGPWG